MNHSGSQGASSPPGSTQNAAAQLVSAQTISAQIVSALMPDGLRLDGVLYAPLTEPNTITACDAVLLIHGTGSNFYAPSVWRGLVPQLRAAGLAVMAVNTRGHDGLHWVQWTGERPPFESPYDRIGGSALERVSDCSLDIQGWCDCLAELGYRRIALVGHSLGAVKAVYSQAKTIRQTAANREAAADQPPPASVKEPPAAHVTAIASLSAPRLSHSYFLSTSRGAAFLDEYTRARELLDAGTPRALMEVRFPLPTVMGAASYVDKYGPDERYNILRFVEQVRVPQLYTYGSLELMQPFAFGGMPEELEALAPGCAAELSVTIVGGGDHSYTGVHDILGRKLLAWLGKLAD